MGILDEVMDGLEFYPGSNRPIVRHPNRVTEHEHQPDTDDWDARPKILKVNGIDREFFTIGQLAKALGRKPVTMRKWERTGVIPKATFRKPSEDPRGARRLYTREQVEGIVQIAKEEGLYGTTSKPISHTDFQARVLVLFRELAGR